MSLTLRQTETTPQRLDLHGLLPETLHGLSDAAIGALPLAVGNRTASLGELFTVLRSDGDDDLLVIEPRDARLDHVGAGLSAGRLHVSGSVGDYVGRAMSGGELIVDGDAGDFAGSALHGGVLRILGDAGDRVGAPAAGERQGQQGGLIHVRGGAGARAGERQRRGMLIIEGGAGDLLAHRMIAGTLYLGGRAGTMTGYGMRRGSLLLRQRPLQLAETLCTNGRQRLGFLPLLLKEVRRLSGGAVDFNHDSGDVERHLGDLACDGRGEILIFR